jgi:dolichol-phosphate mannosyltransferase
MGDLERICKANPELARQFAAAIFAAIGTNDVAGGKSFITPAPELSIALPVHNEAANLRILHTEIDRVLATNEVTTAEIIFVNDGSTDESAAVIADIMRTDDRVVLIELSRNFGHQAALSAGLDNARGRSIVLMDADMQDPPETIGQLLAGWRGGADVVYAVKRDRSQDSLVKRGLARMFYRLLDKVADIEIPVDSGDFCLLDRKVVDHLRRMPERNRYLRGLRSWVGFRQEAVYFDRPARNAGLAKYGMLRSLKLAIRGVVSFSAVPLYLTAIVGFLVCAAAVVVLAYAFAAYFFDVQLQRGWTSLMVVVLVLSGVQLILIGSIGVYIAGIYDEVRRRPEYIVREIVRERQDLG